MAISNTQIHNAVQSLRTKYDLGETKTDELLVSLQRVRVSLLIVAFVVIADFILGIWAG